MRQTTNISRLCRRYFPSFYLFPFIFYLEKENALAVKIYPLDYPGLPSQEQLKALDDFYPNGGPTGDIGKNVTMLCSVGWDWMPPVRDRKDDPG